jgi:two-component system, chemotaxis family, chemotaxis protein CheY
MEKTILVVDDFKTIRSFICEMLESRGYKAVPASDAREAVQLLARKDIRFDLVLTDYSMPGISGLDLLKQIRKSEAYKTIPVIFLTSENRPEKIKRAKELGLTDWITKPYRPEVFFTKVETSLLRSIS